MAVPTVTPCGCCPSWVFLHEKAYQVRDTVIESSVVTKVKGIGRYAGRVLDTADYVTPHQVRGHRAPTLPRFSLSDGAEGWQGDGQGDGDIPPPPPQGTSVFVVVTKQILTENQAQGVCPEVRTGLGGGRQGGTSECVSPCNPAQAHQPTPPERSRVPLHSRPRLPEEGPHHGQR